MKTRRPKGVSRGVYLIETPTHWQCFYPNGGAFFAKSDYSDAKARAEQVAAQKRAQP